MSYFGALLAALLIAFGDTEVLRGPGEDAICLEVDVALEVGLDLGDDDGDGDDVGLKLCRVPKSAGFLFRCCGYLFDFDDEAGL